MLGGAITVEQTPELLHIRREFSGWSAALLLVHFRACLHAVWPGGQNPKCQPLHSGALEEIRIWADRFLAERGAKRIAQVADHLGSRHASPTALGVGTNGRNSAKDFVAVSRVEQSFHAQGRLYQPGPGNHPCAISGTAASAATMPIVFQRVKC